MADIVHAPLKPAGNANPFQHLAKLAGLARPDRLAALLTDQQERWKVGVRIVAEGYLQALPWLRKDAEMLVDLIYSEVLLREKLGETPSLEEYLDRFPQHAEALSRQFAVHRMLAPPASKKDAQPSPRSEPPRPIGALLAALLADQQARWQRGEQLLVERYTQAATWLAENPEALLKLIDHEVSLRRKRGEAPALEEYLVRFPKQADALRRQFAVHPAMDFSSRPPPEKVADLAPSRLPPQPSREKKRNPRARPANSLLEALLADQQARWQRGERVMVERYTQALPWLQGDVEALLDLIYGEVALREKLGEVVSLEEYLDRFPQHTNILRRRLAIASLGSSPSPPSLESAKPPQSLPGIRCHLAREQRVPKI
jgi:hypothetical protein